MREAPDEPPGRPGRAGKVNLVLGDVGRVGSLSDTDIDGMTGVLVPSRRSRELARAVHRLLTRPTVREQYGAAAVDRVAARYTWDRNGDVWVRRGAFVKPVSNDPDACLHDPTGLSGAHKKAYEQISQQTRTHRDPQHT